MTTENILKLIAQYRNKLGVLIIVLFLTVVGISYFVTGRYYHSEIEFYITNTSFTDSKQNENSSKLFIDTEEQELLKSISKSFELFNAVVIKDSLVEYYSKKFNHQAVKELTEATSIEIDKYGKISVTVKDLDNHHGFKTAYHLMTELHHIFIGHYKKFKQDQVLKFKKRITYYNEEKKRLTQSISKYPTATFEIFKTSTDSLTNLSVLWRLQKKTHLKINDILNIGNGIHRLAAIEDYINQATDQLEYISREMELMKGNNIIVTNRKIAPEKYIKWYTHLLNGIKYTILIMIAVIVLLILTNHYKNEIRIIFLRD